MGAVSLNTNPVLTTLNTRVKLPSSSTKQLNSPPVLRPNQNSIECETCVPVCVLCGAVGAVFESGLYSCAVPRGYSLDGNDSFR